MRHVILDAAFPLISHASPCAAVRDCVTFFDVNNSISQQLKNAFESLRQQEVGAVPCKRYKVPIFNCLLICSRRYFQISWRLLLKWLRYL